MISGTADGLQLFNECGQSRLPNLSRVASPPRTRYMFAVPGKARHSRSERSFSNEARKLVASLPKKSCSQKEKSPKVPRELSGLVAQLLLRDRKPGHELRAHHGPVWWAHPINSCNKRKVIWRHPRAKAGSASRYLAFIRFGSGSETCR